MKTIYIRNRSLEAIADTTLTVATATVALILIPVLCLSIAVGAEKSITKPETAKVGNNTMDISIKVGSKSFAVRLEDNATAKAFKALLPLTIRMTELNGNEKYFRLSNDLPADASNPQTIHSGDLMLYGKNTLVLFYKTFATSYSYTRLGRMNDPAGLAAELGAGDVVVTFEAEGN